jgi:type VI secretion system protein ImpG
MTDALLDYYWREIESLRRGARSFAERHPDAAAKLRITADVIDDPHVERLLEGVAFLNARINRKIDDEYPEFLRSLLDIIHPYYTRPIPTTSIVQFVPAPDIPVAQTIAQGTLLDTEETPRGPCRFRTCYPVDMLPLRIDELTLGRNLSALRSLEKFPNARAVLKIGMKGLTEEVHLSKLKPKYVRFYLRSRTSQSLALQKLLFERAVGVVVSRPDAPDHFHILPGVPLREVGYHENEAVFPTTATAKIEYGLLSEYFIFPEKFLFFDIDFCNFDFIGFDDSLTIHILLERTDNALESDLGPSALALGCTPVINLFEVTAEPIHYDHTRAQYQLVPDIRRESAMEVHSVLDVTISDTTGTRLRIPQLFNPGRDKSLKTSTAFWTAARKPAEDKAGTETFISLVEVDPKLVGTDSIIGTRVLCTNRDLPSLLPMGGDHPRLTPVEPLEGAQRIAFVLPLSAPFWPSNIADAEWRLMSHLIANQTSLLGESSLFELKRILELQNLKQSEEVRRMIAAIHAFSIRRAVARAPRHGNDKYWGDAMVRGIDIEVVFDPEKFSDHGLFLFAAILDRFFGIYVSLNSFTRLTTSIRGQSESVRQWPARSGSRPLL